MLMLARLVKFVAGVVVALLVVGILVHVLGANTSNGLVNAVDDAARWLATPFKGVFTPEGKDARIVLNWGLAAVLYSIVGGVIANLLFRASLDREARWRSRRGLA